MPGQLITGCCDRSWTRVRCNN